MVDFRPLSFTDGSRPISDGSDVHRALVIYDGVRIVDVSTGIAGAYCAKLLTDLGADVVFTAPIAGDPLFTYLRTSQRSRRARCRDGVAGRGRHRDRRARARGFHECARHACRITPLGHGGPDDGLDLTEEVLQARSGSLAGHGHADQPPLTVGGRLGEYIVGVYAALGAATAWWRASRTGVPESVDASMLEAIQMTFMTTPVLMANFPGGRADAFRWVMIPGNEPTGDGRYVGITTVTVPAVAGPRPASSAGPTWPTTTSSAR